MALLAHRQDGKLDLDDINYVALRAYGARARRPRLLQRDQPADRYGPGAGRPRSRAGELWRCRRTRASARLVAADQVQRRSWASGYALRGITAEVVPQRVLAGRFRRSARRARNARNRRETAMAGRAGRAGRRPRFKAAGPAHRRGDARPGTHLRENSRAVPRSLLLNLFHVMEHRLQDLFPARRSERGDEKAGRRRDRERPAHRKSIPGADGRRAEPARRGRGLRRPAADVRGRA